MQTPPYLSKGDTVGLVATARKVVPEEIRYAIETLESWGLKVVLAPNLFQSYHQFADTDIERAKALQTFLDDQKNVKAILAVRGGYGTVRMIDFLDFKIFKQTPKWFVGYSDTTVLHAHINANLNIKTIHGMMALDFPPPQNALCSGLQSLHAALFGNPLRYHFPPSPLNRLGCCEGEIIGGNLSVLYSISASVSDIHPEGKILFIEDLDEYLYHIDRMMMQLKRSGKLSKLKGLLVGAFTKMHDNAVSFGNTAEEIILRSVEEYDFPVAFRFPSGHLGTENIAFRMGEKIRLNITANGGQYTELH